MTYYELWQDAIKKLDHNEITLGEYDKLIAPLHREVDTLDKIKAEIENIGEPSCGFWGFYKCKSEALEIIDKYRGEV